MKRITGYLAILVCVLFACSYLGFGPADVFATAAYIAIVFLAVALLVGAALTAKAATPKPKDSTSAEPRSVR